MGSFILMRYTDCMGWLRNLIFGEPNDEYLARISSIKNIGDSSRAGLPQEINGDVENKPDETPVASEQKPDQYHLAGGQKIIPEIEVERIKAQPSGDNKSLEIWAYIHNLASFDIELDKYELLGQRGDLNKFLKPGEIFELRMYQGAMPENDSVRKMYIQYKIVGTGDYFQADHTINYKYEQDSQGNKWYMPDSLKLIRPVRDI